MKEDCFDKDSNCAIWWLDLLLRVQFQDSDWYESEVNNYDEIRVNI